MSSKHIAVHSWYKGGPSVGLAHIVTHKGSNQLITLCGVSLRADRAVIAQSYTSRCTECQKTAAKQKKKTPFCFARTCSVCGAKFETNAPKQHTCGREECKLESTRRHTQNYKRPSAAAQPAAS
jgi:hypothetical protein